MLSCDFMAKSKPNHDAMSTDEAVLRTALNVLRDSVESRRMPSGLPLEGAAMDMHQRAIDRLETILGRVQAGAQLGPRALKP